MMPDPTTTTCLEEDATDFSSLARTKRRSGQSNYGREAACRRASGTGTTGLRTRQGLCAMPLRILKWLKISLVDDFKSSPARVPQRQAETVRNSSPHDVPPRSRPSAIAQRGEFRGTGDISDLRFGRFLRRRQRLAPWLNWIEQPPPKGQVGGSNPLGVTIYFCKISKMRHSTSVRMQLPSGFSVPNHRTEEERRYKSRTGWRHLQGSGATNPHEKPRLGGNRVRGQH